MNPSTCSFIQRLSLGLVAFLLALPAFADWPFVRGPNHNGISDQPLNPLPEPEVVWKKADLAGFGNGGLVLSNGLVYALGTGPKGGLVCFDAANGEQQWKAGGIDWHGNSSPTIDGEHIFSMSHAGGHPKATCFVAKSGEKVWERPLPKPQGERGWGHAGAPLVVGDVVYVNAGGGVALNRETGEVVWSHEGLPGLANPVLFKQGDRSLIALFLGDRLISRDAATGAEGWSIPWATDSAVNAAQPLIFDQKVLISTDYGLGRALYDISADAPSELWSSPKGNGHAFACPVLHDGVVYGIFQGRLSCLDPADESYRWQNQMTGSVLLIDKHIVRLTERGEIELALLSKDAYQPLYKVDVLNGETTRNNPAYSKGHLYIRGDKGSVVCVKVGES